MTQAPPRTPDPPVVCNAVQHDAKSGSPRVPLILGQPGRCVPSGSAAATRDEVIGIVGAAYLQRVIIAVKVRVGNVLIKKRLPESPHAFVVWRLAVIATTVDGFMVDYHFPLLKLGAGGQLLLQVGPLLPSIVVPSIVAIEDDKLGGGLHTHGDLLGKERTLCLPCSTLTSHVVARMNQKKTETFSLSRNLTTTTNRLNEFQTNRTSLFAFTFPFYFVQREGLTAMALLTGIFLVGPASVVVVMLLRRMQSGGVSPDLEVLSLFYIEEGTALTLGLGASIHCLIAHSVEPVPVPFHVGLVDGLHQDVPTTSGVHAQGVS